MKSGSERHEPDGAMDPSRLSAVVVNGNRIRLDGLAGMVKSAGLDPLVFSGAEPALAAMDPNHPPALIVTDVDMPGIDGWGFCRLLRSADYAAFNTVPILVVSATFAGDEPARIAADLGAEGFVAFPADAETFAAQVQAILRGERKRTPLRVLVVDDCIAMAKLLARAFEGEGYRVDLAHTLRDAFAAIDGPACDLAVIDYHLPDGAGDELLDRLHAERPDCACILVTGDLNPELALDWMKRGAAAHVHKPFDPSYLLELCARARREQSLLRLPKLLEKSTEELRRNEERLRRAERRARTVLESVPNGIVAVDTETSRFVFANETLCRMLGYTQEELIGLAPADIHPADAHCVIAQFEKALRGDSEALSDVPLQRKDGRVLPVDVCNAFLEIDGRPCLLVAYTDISARKQAEAALRASDTKLQTILSNVRDVVWSLSYPDFKPLFISPSVETFYGHSREAFFKNPLLWEELVLTEDRGANDQVKKDLAEKGYAYRECRIVRSDGVIRWISDRSKLAYGDDGRPVRVDGVLSDITERKRVEKQLDALVAVVEHSDDPIVIKDLDLRVVASNSAYAKISGHESVRELIGKTDAEIYNVSPEAEPVRTYMQDERDAQRLCPGEYLSREEAVVAASGGVRHVLTKKYPILDAHRKLIGTGQISTDITQRKRMEEALRESENKLRSIFQSMTDVVLVLDRDGRYLEIAPTRTDLLYRPPQEMVGKPVREVLPPALADLCLNSIGEALQSGQSVPVDYQMEIAGHSFWFAGVATPFTENSVLWVARDITERKRVEEEARQISTRLSQLTRHVQAAREEESRRIAVWLHDEVGQMLTRARMDAMLLELVPANAEGEAGSALASLKRTLDDAVVSIRNISSDLRPPILDDFGLVAVLEWTIHENEKRLKIPFHLEVENVPDPLDADLSAAFYRMARECLTNIARHAQASAVDIRLSGDGRELTLVVRDDGRGLAPGVAENPASFGISQLRERAAALGGQMQIESPPGRGTTVRITAPLHPPETREGAS